MLDDVVNDMHTLEDGNVYRLCNGNVIHYSRRFSLRHALFRKLNEDLAQTTCIQAKYNLKNDNLSTDICQVVCVYFNITNLFVIIKLIVAVD